MIPWPRGLLASILAVLLAGETVFACDTCRQTPCVITTQPAPKFTYVTEMVPFTVMKTKTTVDLVPVCTETIFQTKIDTVYDEQIMNVCKPVFDTVFHERNVTICRPVSETTMVCQPYRVCRPVTTTQQVVEYDLNVRTERVVVTGKAHCGHSGGSCTCNTMVRTCVERVPVVREITKTNWVTEMHTQMVPVVHCRMETEQRVEKVPVTVCRMVNQVVRVQVPRLVFRNEPKTVVYKTAVLTCTEVPVTVYRPVTKTVPIVEPSPQAIPSSQGGVSPTEPEPDSRERQPSKPRDNADLSPLPAEKTQVPPPPAPNL
jgi:hypothetical protein